MTCEGEKKESSYGCQIKKWFSPVGILQNQMQQLQSHTWENIPHTPVFSRFIGGVGGGRGFSTSTGVLHQWGVWVSHHVRSWTDHFEASENTHVVKYGTETHPDRGEIKSTLFLFSLFPSRRLVHVHIKWALPENTACRSFMLHWIFNSKNQNRTVFLVDYTETVACVFVCWQTLAWVNAWLTHRPSWFTCAAFACVCAVYSFSPRCWR